MGMMTVPLVAATAQIVWPQSSYFIFGIVSIAFLRRVIQKGFLTRSYCIWGNRQRGCGWRRLHPYFEGSHGPLAWPFSHSSDTESDRDPERHPAGDPIPSRSSTGRSSAHFDPLWALVPLVSSPLLDLATSICYNKIVPESVYRNPETCRLHHNKEKNERLRSVYG